MARGVEHLFQCNTCEGWFEEEDDNLDELYERDAPPWLE
jgi:hypothetical protein